MKLRLFILLLANVLSAAIPNTNKEFITNSSNNTTFQSNQNSNIIESNITESSIESNKPQKKPKEQNSMLGVTFGVGISFDIFSASANWSGMREIYYPYRSLPFTPSMYSQSVGAVVSAQYIGHDLHFLSDTRIVFSANINKGDKTKYVISADELSGYYFAFSGNSGLAIKMGITAMMTTNGVQDDDSFYFANDVSAVETMGFFGLGSKVGLEYNIGRFAIGAFFSSFYLWWFSYNEDLYRYKLAESFPHNFNADKKSFPYNIHTSIVYRF